MGCQMSKILQMDLFTGKTIKENTDKKRTKLIGFFVSEKEKKQILKSALKERHNVSDYMRKMLGFEE